MCETLPGRKSAGRFRWLKSSMDGSCWFYFTQITAAVLRLSHVLSHGVAMFGGLAGGGGLWRMGTRGQIMGNGHSPGHQPFHRSRNSTGGNAHHARRESVDHQQRRWGEKIEITLRKWRLLSKTLLHLIINVIFKKITNWKCLILRGSHREKYVRDNVSWPSQQFNKGWFNLHQPGGTQINYSYNLWSLWPLQDKYVQTIWKKHIQYFKLIQWCTLQHKTQI